MEQLQSLKGTVESVVFKNDKNGFAIVEINTGEELHTVTGVMPGISAGENITARGSFINHRDFGVQFKADEVLRASPVGTEAIYRYLSSGAVKGIGIATAEKLVELFGENTLSVMEKEPERLTMIKGITRDKARRMSEALRRDSGMREVLLSLSRYGITPAEAIRIWKVYGNQTANVVEGDPYSLCGESCGIDFYRADAIAQRLKRPQNDPCRIRAGLLYVLRHNAGNGHTCLPSDKLCETAEKFMSVEFGEAEEILSGMELDGSIVIREVSGKRFAFLKKMYEAEAHIAERLAVLLRYPAQSVVGIEKQIAAIEKEFGIRYAEAQKDAIREALGKGSLILTGGPGTGKTTTLNAMIRILKIKGETVLLAAPTGRAAKRMSELTGQEAKTIHRLLQVEWSEDEQQSFAKNEKNLLECDAVIIDELSMVDVQLFDALLRAVPLGCRLILVGDSDQLPSVGAGNVLGDLIASKRIPTVQLCEVFRQAAESMIVTNAHKIVRGERPDLSCRDRDFFFLKVPGQMEISDTVLDLCVRRLPQSYGYSSLWDIEVLCPGKKGELGTLELNKKLQKLLNPPSKQKEELSVNGTVLRVGDKVMQIKNDYSLPYDRDDGDSGEGVFNGDIGRIEKIDKHAGILTVRMDDRVVLYDTALSSELELAYAMTVHKSQGNEFCAVVMPMYPGAPQLCYRNLLYTAVTRAKKLLILVGREDVVFSMVENDRKTRRYSGLCSMMEEIG